MNKDVRQALISGAPTVATTLLYILCPLHFVIQWASDMHMLNLFVAFWKFYRIIHIPYHIVEILAITVALLNYEFPVIIGMFEVLKIKNKDTAKKFVRYIPQLVAGVAAILAAIIAAVCNGYYLWEFIEMYLHNFVPSVFFDRLAIITLMIFTGINILVELAILICVAIVTHKVVTLLYQLSKE